jgi:endonuclease I
MKFSIATIVILFQIQVLLAQPPEGYYDGTENLYGSYLKHSLHEIIKDHTTYPYTSSSETDVWDILKETDRDTTNPDNVILFYTGWSVDADQEYNNGHGWSREHVWAKSRGDFGTTPPAGTDINNLRPADISVNSARSNRSFDTCSVPYTDGELYTGCFTDTARWVWQPRPEVQGDVARMIFYMVTRYEGDNNEPDLEIVNYILPKENKSPYHALLSRLLKWNESDPVDSFELHRNDVVYSYQHNRNPFIDHPEYINRIWTSDSTLGTNQIAHHDLPTVYPNPATTIIHFKNADGFTKQIYSTNGILYGQTKSNYINIAKYPSGVYIIILMNQKNKVLQHTKLIKL